MNKEIFDLQSTTVPLQMHDEKISRIELTDNGLRLHFEDLHFNSNYRHATIDFEGMEDVTCCAHMDIYEVKCDKILGGTRCFADELESFIEQKKISLVVLDMWVGYGGQLMITGEVIENDIVGDKKFSLFIDATSMVYTWY